MRSLVSLLSVLFPVGEVTNTVADSGEVFGFVTSSAVDAGGIRGRGVSRVFAIGSFDACGSGRTTAVLPPGFGLASTSAAPSAFFFHRSFARSFRSFFFSATRAGSKGGLPLGLGADGSTTSPLGLSSGHGTEGDDGGAPSVGEVTISTETGGIRVVVIIGGSTSLERRRVGLDAKPQSSRFGRSASSSSAQSICECVEGVFGR